MSDRRFEALVVVAPVDALDRAALEKIARLRALGMHVGIVGGTPSDAVDRLACSGETCGALACSDAAGAEVVVVDESGSRERRAPDQSDLAPRSMRALGDETAALQKIADVFCARGIARSDVHVIRPPTDLDVLDDQIRRRSEGDVPSAGQDPGWTFSTDTFEAEQDGVHQSLLATADGVIGASGAPLAHARGGVHWVLASGVYTGRGPESHLLTAPVAFHVPVTIPADATLRRTLDLRAGVLHESLDAPGTYESARFASLARPGTAVMRVRGVDHGGDAVLMPPALDEMLDSGESGREQWIRVGSDDGGVTAAGAQWRASETSHGGTLDRVVAYEARPTGVSEPASAVARTRAAAELGFDQLLNEHRRAWSQRWDDADVVVEGDDELQFATRFALFHLMASVKDEGEAAVGARGLSGPSYRGHVFWDADTFVLPFLASTHPSAARAVLEYRVRRLPAAMEAARRAGRAGARFPWESAATGDDVTPRSARDRTGKIVAIRTGQLEEHIVADVAWAAAYYIDWTGDVEFARGPGLRLLVETARYWASRVRVDADGSAHIDGVIGPDEYHEAVDDNAFTNVMARWNLRRALTALRSGAGDVIVSADEQGRWHDVADSLVDGFDPGTRVYEQFAGFNRLEPLLIAEVAPRRPIAADLLLGADRVRGAQVTKQADVLMLHHMVPEETAPKSLEPNLRFYEPRTAHGSSLSPAIHASVFACARDFDHALSALRVACRIDLDDLTGSTAGGLHLATMGGLWQALAFGFAGLRARDDALHVDPHLPPQWRALELRLRFRGRRVRLRIESSGFEVEADAPIGVNVGGEVFTVGPESRAFRQ